MSKAPAKRAGHGTRWKGALALFGATIAIAGSLLWADASVAKHDSNPNEDCPAGTYLVAKYDWKGSGYVFEKPPGGDSIVTIDSESDETGGSWTSTDPISDVILKGSTGTHTYDYAPPAFEGTFSKDALPLNPGGQRPDISNIQFCGLPRVPDLTPVKTNNVDGEVALGQSFTWKIHTSNIGSANAVFAAGARVLYDRLPADATYPVGAVTPVTSSTSGSLACTIQAGSGATELACDVPAGGSFTMPPGSYFDISFQVTPQVAGVLNNPRDSGCWVNLGTGAIDESNTLNNTCSNAVDVIAGRIEVVKVDVGVDGTWEFAVTGPSNPANKTITGDGSVQFSGLKPGTYSVEELNGEDEACPASGAAEGTFETLSGPTGEPGDATIGATRSGIPVVAGAMTTVYFFNRECGQVLAAPNLYIQKYKDPLGNLTGRTPIEGVSFIVKRDGVAIPGSPFLSDDEGLIFLGGVDEGVYTVEEVVPASYRLAGSTRDDGADLVVEATYPGQPAAVTLEVNDSVRLTFYNQPLGTIRVQKTEVVDGVSSPGYGWAFELSGCGIADDGITNAAGIVQWTVPVREDCAYQVEEVAQAGWKVTPANRIRTAQPLLGEVVVVTFENSRTTATPTPTPTGTPPTATPTSTPTTVLPTSTPTTVPPTTTPVIGPATPPAEPTPKPPPTGTGTDSSQAGIPLVMVLAGTALMLLSGGAWAAARVSERRR